MKYIKTYEQGKKQQKYWLLPTDYRFEIFLKEINVDKLTIKNFLDILKNNKNDDFIFIGHGNSLAEEDRQFWSFNIYKGKMLNSAYENDNYKFQPLLFDYKTEVDANKYNL